MRHIPLAMLRFLATTTKRVHPGLSQIVQAGILADTTDQSFDARPLQERFGLELTSLEEWVAERLT